MQVTWHIVVTLIAAFFPFASLTLGQEFEVLDHCDQREFPSSDEGGLVPGTRGCSAEGTVIGDWYLAEIVQGDVGPPVAIPFAFGTHKIVNQRTVGFFAHHLSDSRQAFCRIPPEWQQRWEDFEFYVVGRDEICFSCAVRNSIRYGRWKIGTDPVLVDATSLSIRASQLPGELRQWKRRHQISRTQWYEDPPRRGNTLQVTATADGGLFCLSAGVGIFGELVDSDTWRWQLSLAEVKSVVGSHYDSLSVPAMVPPVSNVAIAVQSFRDEGEIDVLLVESGELHVLDSMSDVSLHDVHCSPNQRFVLVTYSRNWHEDITSYLHHRLIDVQAGTASELTFKDKDLHVVVGIDDTGRIVENGDERAMRVTNRITPTPKGPAIEFDILLPSED